MNIRPWELGLLTHDQFLHAVALAEDARKKTAAAEAERAKLK